jgi:hypothetical protein
MKIKFKGADFITFLVIFILVTSIFGLYTNRPQTDQQVAPEPSFFYEEVAFYEQSDGFFGVYLQRSDGQVQPISFRLDPRTMNDILIESDLNQKIRNATKIYTSYNPNLDTSYAKMAVAIGEVTRLLPLITVNRAVSKNAFTEDANPIDPNVPIKTCKDATLEYPVIEFEIGNQNRVNSEGFCINVIGKNADDLILSADRLGYSFVGIY